MSFGIGLPQDGNGNKGYELFLTATIFVLLATAFVAVRVSFRLHQRNIGLDDLTISLSLVRLISEPTLARLLMRSPRSYLSY
jgi:hypothetical protein